MEKTIDITLEELDLSVRSYNCLKRAGINGLEDLMSKTYEEICSVRNMHPKCVQEIIYKMAIWGVGFKESDN